MGGGGGTAAAAAAQPPAPPRASGLGPLPERRRAGRIVAVALSGGVDSAIAAAQLVAARRAGDEVFAVHLRTWDARDEGGGPGGSGEATADGRACPAEADAAAAGAVARALGLEVVAVNAVADYWCDVFRPLRRLWRPA